VNLNGMSNWRLGLAYASVVLILVSAFMIVMIDYWFLDTIHTHNFPRLLPLVPAGQIMAAAGFILALFAKGHTRQFFVLAAFIESWCWLGHTTFS